MNLLFFFNDTATTEIYTLSLHDALPISSTGYRPAKTCGLISLKPGKGSAAGLSASVTVSPTCAALSSLIPAMTNPTSPASNSPRDCDFGVNTPTCSHG